MPPGGEARRSRPPRSRWCCCWRDGSRGITRSTGTSGPVAVPSGVPLSKLLRRKSVPSTKVVGFGLDPDQLGVLLEVGELELLDLRVVSGGLELRRRRSRPRPRSRAGRPPDCRRSRRRSPAGLEVVHHPLEGDGLGQLPHRVVVRAPRTPGSECHGRCQGTGRDHGTRPTSLERHYAGTPLNPPARPIAFGPANVIQETPTAQAGPPPRHGRTQRPDGSLGQRGACGATTECHRTPVESGGGSNNASSAASGAWKSGSHPSRSARRIG